MNFYRDNKMQELLKDPILMRGIYPFVLFFIGILIANSIKLHNFKHTTVFLMGVPVGLFMSGFMVNASRVVVETPVTEIITSKDVYFSFENGVPEFMTFAAVMIFLGTSTPTLFQELRRKLTNAAVEPI